MMNGMNVMNVILQRCQSGINKGQGEDGDGGEKVKVKVKVKVINHRDLILLTRDILIAGFKRRARSKFKTIPL